jgi:hypothetical protein
MISYEMLERCYLLYRLHERKELRHGGLEADCMHACGVGVQSRANSCRAVMCSRGGMPDLPRVHVREGIKIIPSCS